MKQLEFDLPGIVTEFIPSTRYQGSKARLVKWIGSRVATRSFDTVLDAFGGTGVVGYWLKQKGKQVTYNDILRFNYLIGLALIENNSVYPSSAEVDGILVPQAGRSYQNFIAQAFQGIYYTDEENEWLDVVVQNINDLTSSYKQALAYYALFQACLVKRPFNLFHRKNLYLRFANVERSFGNKTTWDTPFDVHFRGFIDEMSGLVLDNGRNNRALNQDVMEIKGDFNLVYIDPPYITRKGVGVDYHHFYHFLEGLARYDEWPALIDYTTKHRRLERVDNPWLNPAMVSQAFMQLFDHFRESILVVSYRADGIPSVVDLERMMRTIKKRVDVYVEDYQYVLSTRRTAEVLIVGE